MEYSGRSELQLGYNSMGINSATWNSLGFPGGDVHVFSATLDRSLI